MNGWRKTSPGTTRVQPLRKSTEELGANGVPGLGGRAGTTNCQDVLENENKVLAYVGYLGWLGASPNTIRQHLFAIKNVHKRSGRGDPLDGMRRIWILVNALDRRSTTRKPRRLGVTPEMLVWLGKNILDPLVNEQHTIVHAEAVIVTGAMQTAWFFMLRAFGESNGVDEEMVTRGCDLRLSTNGAETGKATEVTLYFRKTKSDQLALGTARPYQRQARSTYAPYRRSKR